MPTKHQTPSPSLFVPLDDEAGKHVEFQFEGHPVSAPSGTSIAAALLLHGAEPFRTTPVGGAPRAPYCMMGVCFDCLVEVDGVPSRQACQVLVRPGMVVKHQHGASALPSTAGGRHGD